MSNIGLLGLPELRTENIPDSVKNLHYYRRCQAMGITFSLVCENCKETFIYWSKKRKYCSDKCFGLSVRKETSLSKSTSYRRKREAGLTKPFPRLKINQDFFFTWTLELAWVLGLLWSDGNLYKNKINLVSKDKDLIETVANLIGDKSLVRSRDNKKYWLISFGSKIVAQHLRELGLHEAKSFTIKWVQGMPSKYESHFVRGLFDGDGWVYFKEKKQSYQMHAGFVTASESLSESFRSWLINQGLKFNHRKDGNKWTFNIHRIEYVKRFYQIIYPSPNVPHLLRKKILFDKWMNRPPSHVGRSTWTTPGQREETARRNYRRYCEKYKTDPIFHEQCLKKQRQRRQKIKEKNASTIFL